MKRLLFIILFVFACSMAFTQSRIGYSVSEITREFSESHYNLIGRYIKDNTYYMTMSIYNASVGYLFDSNNICNATLIIPNNQGALNYYVESYNKRYVVVGPRQWKMYSTGGISTIDLIYTDEGGYFFLWQELVTGKL
jgi:hypothetical protein